MDGAQAAASSPAAQGGAASESATDQQLHLAMDSALGTLSDLARRPAAERLNQASILVVLGPGARLSNSLLRRSAADREATFDLNFPWRWDEARRERGGAAGPYPASRLDVLALSDLLLKEHRLACVVRSAPTPQGPQSAPASLAAFVKGRLLLEHRSPRDVEGLAEELGAALDDLPELSWSRPVWRRMGANSWVVDLVLENVGARPTGPSKGPAKELRLPKGIRLGVEARGESYEWLACGAAPLQPVVLEDHPIRDGVAQLPSLGPGEGLRVRIILRSKVPGAGRPVLDLRASSGRVIGASLLALTPPESP